MANRCKVIDKCDDPIDPVLANNINDLFKNGMNEPLYDEMTKKKRKASHQVRRRSSKEESFLRRLEEARRANYLERKRVFHGLCG